MAKLFTLFDIPIQFLDYEESLTAVITQAKRTPVRIFFVDSYDLVRAQELKGYKRSLQLAEFCFSAGLPIKLGAKFLGQSAPAHISPAEWVPSLFDRLGKEGQPPQTLFCLGVPKGCINILSKIIATRWPRITLIGCKEAPTAGEDEDSVIDIIEQKSPSLLLVGSQIHESERFIYRHWHRLQYAGVRIAIAGHDTLESISGSTADAPRFARSLHLQWLFHPVSFYKRYIKGTFQFILLLIHQKGSQS